MTLAVSLASSRVGRATSFCCPTKRGLSKEPKPRTPGFVSLPTRLTRRSSRPASTSRSLKRGAINAGSLGIRMVNGFRQVAVHCKNNGMYTARRWSPCEFPENHFFQGSIEEQRLDAVLHYFDMLAYNQQRNLISAEDISGVSGYHLAVIGSRDIINYYLDQIKNNWEYLPYKKRISAEEPFDNLRKLLADVKRINEKKFRENKVEEK